jgi:hypothetical protein
MQLVIGVVAGFVVAGCVVAGCVGFVVARVTTAGGAELVALFCRENHHTRTPMTIARAVKARPIAARFEVPPLSDADNTIGASAGGASAGGASAGGASVGGAVGVFVRLGAAVSFLVFAFFERTAPRTEGLFLGAIRCVVRVAWHTEIYLTWAGEASTKTFLSSQRTE